MSGKIVCNACMGNGYRRIWKDQNEKEKIIIQCAKCNSSGEVEITEEEILGEIKEWEKKLQ
jgi:DnaJ-class molecular chaperone